MGERQLKEHCKKYLLPKTGKKPELVARLKEYALRYNAQLGNPEPAQRTGNEIGFPVCVCSMLRVPSIMLRTLALCVCSHSDS